MRTFTIFYSWQSDRDARSCKNFIRIAADDAARRVGERLGVQVLVDADTEGVSGTPPISDTILKKISASDLFLADMTFVGKTEQEKLLPNPNVMGEYGYALKANGFERILLCNEHGLRTAGEAAVRPPPHASPCPIRPRGWTTEAPGAKSERRFPFGSRLPSGGRSRDS